MHTKRDIETPGPKLPAQFPVGLSTFVLIENDKLDPRNIGHEAGFRLANDPCQLRFRPRVLNCADDRERMAGIADMGKADDADTFGRRLFKHRVTPGNAIRKERGESV